MKPKIDTKPTLEVWMDGQCQLCQTSRNWCELRDPSARIRFVDFRSEGDDDLPTSRAEHERSMWVRDDDGALLEGFAAWRRIMSELPGWRWLARLAATRPFAAIGPAFYRLIAAHRNRFRTGSDPHQPGAGTPSSVKVSNRGHSVHR